MWERDTIWVSRTESQQFWTKIERKCRRGGLWVTGEVCRKVGRKRNQRVGKNKAWERRKGWVGKGGGAGVHSSEASVRAGGNVFSVNVFFYICNK